MSNLFLSLIDLEPTEKEIFLNYLCKCKHLESIYYLEAEFGDKLLEFLDLFQGETIKVPSKNELVSIANNSIIYNYLKERDFTEDAYSRASTLFKKRVTVLERIVEKMSILEEENND